VLLRPFLAAPIAGYTMDVEQAFSTFVGPPVPRRDFGFLVAPKRLRYSAAHPFYFGAWSRLVFGLGCAFSQYSSTEENLF